MAINRREVFSAEYDDDPNCMFYMQLSASHQPGHYRVRYFTLGGHNIVHNYISGHFKTSADLTKEMFRLRDEEGRDDLTPRLWMYVDELWDAELKRLEEKTA